MATLIRGDGRTVNAFQDSVLGDFAFGGKSGIIKNIGQACGLDTTTLNVAKVKSGMVVIQGRQITLDGTDTITLPVPTGSTVYWTTLFLKLDMSAQTADGLTGKVTLEKLEYTASYPAVPTSDNLKIQPSGVAYLGLYRFKNTANGITESSAIAETIDSGDLSEQVQNEINDINGRLDSLGFKEGSAIMAELVTSEINAIYKQGKYVYGHIKAERSRVANASHLLFTIPSEFIYGGKTKERLISGIESDYGFGEYVELCGRGRIMLVSDYPFWTSEIYAFYKDGSVRISTNQGDDAAWSGEADAFDITFGYETE